MSPTRREMERRIADIVNQHTMCFTMKSGCALAYDIANMFETLCQPAPLSRAQVERVFRKHGIIFYEVKQERAFIDDLMGLLGGEVPACDHRGQVQYRHQIGDAWCSTVGNFFRFLDACPRCGAQRPT